VFFLVLCFPKSFNTNELQVNFFYMDSAFLFKMALPKRQKKQNVEIARVLGLGWENCQRGCFEQLQKNLRRLKLFSSLVSRPE
jgi:hypothetical protein